MYSVVNIILRRRCRRRMKLFRLKEYRRVPHSFALFANEWEITTGGDLGHMAQANHP